MQWDKHAREKCLVFFLERKSEAVDNGTKYFQQLGDTVMAFRLVNELEEDVVDGTSDESS